MYSLWKPVIEEFRHAYIEWSRHCFRGCRSWWRMDRAFPPAFFYI